MAKCWAFRVKDGDHSLKDRKILSLFAETQKTALETQFAVGKCCHLLATADISSEEPAGVIFILFF